MPFIWDKNLMGHLQFSEAEGSYGFVYIRFA